MTSLRPALMTAVALTVAVVESQSPSDFTGTWSMDRERSESMHQSEVFEPPTLVITQSATEVTIETRRRLSTGRAVYAIGERGGAVEASPAAAPHAYWEGATLVTEAARTVQGQTVSVRESRTLDTSGTEMTVHTLLIVQHGYSFKGARNYGSAKDLYRRVTP